jgi:hypothetical protein
MFRIRPYFIFSEIKFEPFRKKNSTPNEYILPIGLSMCMNPAVGERERERERETEREREMERERLAIWLDQIAREIETRAQK